VDHRERESMDSNIWFWVWLALAVILSLGEIFTAGFFLLPFGIGAAIAALLEWLFPGSIAWQWAAFIGVSSLLLIFLRRFAVRISPDSPVRVAGNRLIGKQGIVLRRLDSAGGGSVRVEREEWRADAPGYEPLEEGALVEVIAVEGTHLLVRPVTEPVVEHQ
jgi:membrane protein implicated in regulation of membrane protease activity